MNSPKKHHSSGGFDFVQAMMFFPFLVPLFFVPAAVLSGCETSLRAGSHPADAGEDGATATEGGRLMTWPMFR